MILLSSGSDEIPLDRAEQSGLHVSGLENAGAANAIDNDLETGAITGNANEDHLWLGVYFQSSYTVDKVVVEKGSSIDSACVWTVSVYDGEIETVCGTYTVGKSG